MIELATLLAHREPTVIAAFAARWDVTAAESDALFEDVLAWLWLANRPAAPALTLEAPMRIVDEMWHELVLHTACYRALCDRWFGRFVHHEPEAAAPPRDPSTHASDAQWRFIAAQLGVDRLLRWYVALPLRFDDAWFRTGRRTRDFGYTPNPRLVATWQARRS